ncbi:hypothetical protein [Nostoc sp.]|uniref:hypothetical protein n=1 Tax=Nostoc sp. TaxID=1180 RepID=UPI002FF834F0
MWFNKSLLNRRGTQSAERKAEILEVTLKELIPKKGKGKGDEIFPFPHLLQEVY